MKLMGLSMSENDDEIELTDEDVKGLQSLSAISNALGATPILPGEFEELYRKGLADLIAELDAKTVLQVYLAEKIFDCLWWIRRYEEQKRSTLIVEMASKIKGQYTSHLTEIEIYVREALLSNCIDDVTANAVESVGHSLVSLRQAAFKTKHVELQQLDHQIALQAKILAGLQASYEVAYNRKLNIERLQLQNDQLRKDLGAIEVTKGASQDEKPKASRRKSS